jgi:hypothetical protein
MSVRTGMYHFEVSRTAMYRVRYVLVHTSTYRHVLPCTRCTGFQMAVVQDSEGHPSHQTSNVKCSIIMLSCSRCGWYKYHGTAFLCIPKGCRLVEDEMSVAPGPAGPARNRPELVQARELLRHHDLESWPVVCTSDRVHSGMYQVLVCTGMYHAIVWYQLEYKPT